MLEKWLTNRKEMQDEINSSGFWNLNRFVYSQVHLLSLRFFCSSVDDNDGQFARWMGQILLDERFWDAIPAENVLIFQTGRFQTMNGSMVPFNWFGCRYSPDAVLCRSGIEDYLDFDYVGAPWYLCDSMFVGSGLMWTSAIIDLSMMNEYYLTCDNYSI